MARCYILYSSKLNKFYVGITSNNLEQRIKEHNENAYGMRSYTAKTDDWELFLFIQCASNSVALKIERHIKKMKSTTYIRNLKKYPEMVEKL
jgi:putative endonuclease